MEHDVCAYCEDVINEHGCRCNGYEPESPQCRRCGGTGYDDHDCMEDICVCRVLFTGVCPDCLGEG
jgi:hypothetical protein